MRDDDAADLVASLLEVAGIWQNVIDAGRVHFGELKTAVNDENIIVELDRDHVAAYLLDAAEHDDTDSVRCQGRYRLAASLISRDGVLEP